MRLNDLLNNDSIALSRLITEGQNTLVLTSNYFDGNTTVTAQVTTNPQDILAHLVQSHFFANNRQECEPLLRLIGIWNEIGKGNADEVGENRLRSVVQNISVTAIEGATRLQPYTGKLIFLATYISRGIENAILKSKLRNNVNISVTPLTANISIELSGEIPENIETGETSEDLTQELLADINQAVERFCDNNNVTINVVELAALDTNSGNEIDFEKAA